MSTCVASLPAAFRSQQVLSGCGGAPVGLFATLLLDTICQLDMPPSIGAPVEVSISDRDLLVLAGR